ncbi:hypothetical protein G3T36_18290 [Diaminobutyricibacter tongyongensis]|uniref:CU044_5270 family protein n=1 Tax=Leifsonia tongyongensis TaxID=1268043 RepID=A0A6L9Y2A2_9MICO|nr:CU044_5270 family protein [Diaminobutyricibacter tongyongensis]NEN07809.1 hypothetical protein [Diaminobutyricibacter tongyongensis]
MNPLTIESELLPGDSDFDRMKSQLFERIEDTERLRTPHLVPVTRRRTPARRRKVWVSITVVAAVALGVTVIATNVVGPHAASAEAAEVLHRAASATIKSVDLTVGTGQFLKISTTEVALSFSGQEAAYEQPQAITVYMPSDKNDRWVRGHQWLAPGKAYGNAKDFIDQVWKDPHHGDLHLYQAAGGDFGGKSPNYSTEIATMPRESGPLLTYLYQHAEGSASKDEAAFTHVQNLLTTGLVPADLRSAMYDALAEIPGVYLADGQANLDGKRGVAISRKESSRPFAQQIIIDPGTGLLIGVRELSTQQWGPVPAGSIVDWTAVEASVVDKLPAGPYSAMPQAG